MRMRSKAYDQILTLLWHLKTQYLSQTHKQALNKTSYTTMDRDTDITQMKSSFIISTKTTQIVLMDLAYIQDVMVSWRCIQ